MLVDLPSQCWEASIAVKHLESRNLRSQGIIILINHPQSSTNRNWTTMDHWIAMYCCCLLQSFFGSPHQLQSAAAPRALVTSIGSVFLARYGQDARRCEGKFGQNQNHNWMYDLKSVTSCTVTGLPQPVHLQSDRNGNYQLH